MSGRQTRAKRAACPLARDSMRKIAEASGGCLRPVQLRRTDTVTGETVPVMVPCGATLASICPPCAERAKAQRAHADRLAEALRYEPCSPACANWLRFGIQPKNARPGLIPGACKGKAHRSEHCATRGGGSWSPASGPARRWPTTAPAGRPGWSPPSAWRCLTRPGTPGRRSPRATPTTCLPSSGCCTWSPAGPGRRPR